MAPAAPATIPAFRENDLLRAAHGAENVLPERDSSDALPDLYFRRYLIHISHDREVVPTDVVYPKEIS